MMHLNQLLKECEDIVEKSLKSSEYIRNIVANWYRERDKLRVEWFRERILMPFENTLVFAPAGYDGILTNLYGDYMTPPPPEKQFSHRTYPAYWK